MTVLRRTNSQRSIASQNSTRSSYSHSHRTPRKKTSSRPSSLLVSPPPSPRPAYRSKSTDEYCVGSSNTGSICNPLKATASTTIDTRRSTTAVTENDELTISFPVPTTSLEKLAKLKDRLIGAAGQNSLTKPESDDESTPLVSEMSTPSHSQSDSVFTHNFSPDGSSDLSPPSGRSIPQGGERSIDTDYYDTLSLVVHETTNGKALSRQNAEDWDNPETPV